MYFLPSRKNSLGPEVRSGKEKGLRIISACSATREQSVQYPSNQIEFPNQTPANKSPMFWFAEITEKREEKEKNKDSVLHTIFPLGYK